jgi:hypothetical protein
MKDERGPDPTGPALAERLERGEVVPLPPAPFVLSAADRDFLLAVRLGRLARKDVSFNPATGCVAGADCPDPARLARLLSDFSAAMTAWLAGLLPDYAGAWRLDRATLSAVEEATRRLRLNARNDLFHIDAFPNRPSHGDRLLRVFVNVSPDEPRVWATSAPFAQLLRRYGVAAGLPGEPATVGVLRRLRDGLARLFGAVPPRGDYDAFMLRFHDHLKRCDELQERGPKRLHTFPPGSAWLAMTDSCVHAVLRGRGALEHSYFVGAAGLALPDESPAALLRRVCGEQALARAA